jgi:hypothetical protein
MKKILFISYHFYPDNAISAVRPTKFIKYLSINHNVSCDIITVHNNSKKDSFNNNEVFYNKIYYIKTNKKFIYKKKNNSSSLNIKRTTESTFPIFVIHKIIRKVKRKLRPIISLFNQYLLFSRGIKIIRNIDLNSYYGVFSSYGPEFTHLLARYCKKRNSKLVWIADFRDSVFNPIFSFFPLNLYQKKYPSFVCRKSSFITVVSKGTIPNLFLKNSQRVSLLTNGYDSDDIMKINEKKYNKFTILITGNLYDGLRSIDPLLNCIKELVDQGIVNLSLVSFLYLGDDETSLTKSLRKYDFLRNYNYGGYVDRETSLKIQNKSHLLVLLTWNNYNYEGVISGKFYEYINSGTPIITIVNGNKANSEIKEYISKTNSGFCYESSNHSQDYSQMKAYLIYVYNCFVKNTNITTCVNNEEKDKFDYKNITKSLNDLFFR